MAEPVRLLSTTVVGRAGDGPHVLITAGVHGDELEPMAAVRRLRDLIVPDRLRGRVTLVPVVNESAYARNARSGEDGLDLARTCPGDSTGTITQRVAAALSACIRQADYYIDLHTGGVLFRLCALSGYMLHDDPQVRATQRHMARAFGLPVIWGTSAGLEGRSLSVARDAEVPAIYCEFGGGGTFESRVVEAYANGCLRVLGELGLFGPKPPLLEARIIEDDRDRSGVLQVQHPAPAAGFFEPAVELGQEVATGQMIGRIIDALGAVLSEVPANEAGVVVMLRSWRHVNAGDALAALASTERMRGSP
jgi:predicted deacylase